MARARHPVKCTNCGYVTTPVSGFCPECLELLPLARRGIPFVPLALIAGALLLAVLASVSGARPERVTGIAEPSPRTAAPSAVRTDQTGAPSAVGTPASGPPATIGTPPASAAPVTESAPPAAATASGSPTPAAVLGVSQPPLALPGMPSTTTDLAPHWETARLTRRY